MQQMLDFKKLQMLAEENSKTYQTGNPFPHIHIDNVFNPQILDTILDEFPHANDIDWIKFNNPNEKKLASRDETQFGETTRNFIHALNSGPFIGFLEKLTGIDNLIPDPWLEGGGLHQILNGGLLKIHADFNKHSKTKLDRRLNVLVYLNKDWEESYGGHFELWDETMTKSEVKILPIFNRMALFSTTSKSFHGHPDPLTCPENRSRKSIALYYYTNGRPENEVLEGLEKHDTLFVNRHGKEEVAENTYQPSPAKEFLKKLIPPIFLDIKRKL